MDIGQHLQVLRCFCTNHISICTDHVFFAGHICTEHVFVDHICADHLCFDHDHFSGAGKLEGPIIFALVIIIFMVQGS